MRLFKAHPSSLSKIMGAVGLSESQTEKMNELKNRKEGGGKPLTSNMEADLAKLIFLFNNPELPAGAKTFLNEWYSNDFEEIRNKYMDKGNFVENEVIDLSARVLGLGEVFKNKQKVVDDYFVGTCDVLLPDLIIDVKASWSNKTLQAVAANGANDDYIWQGRGYMRLFDRENFIVFHGLVDTPAEVNYGKHISYSHIPESERWVAYSVKRDMKIESEMVERVKMCRQYLEVYSKSLTSNLGKVHY